MLVRIGGFKVAEPHAAFSFGPDAHSLVQVGFSLDLAALSFARAGSSLDLAALSLARAACAWEQIWGRWMADCWLSHLGAAVQARMVSDAQVASFELAMSGSCSGSRSARERAAREYALRRVNPSRLRRR
jgi:hypothetical protein